MFVPFWSSPSIERRGLWKRKGGRGFFKSNGGQKTDGLTTGVDTVGWLGGSGGSGGGSPGGSSGGFGPIYGLGGSATVNTGSGLKTVSTWGNGIAEVSTIPAGSPFAGRSVGGGTRGDVYGSRTYGSGYPGISGNDTRGVSGLGFPFFFWPVMFGAAAGSSAYAAHSYFYSDEYLDDENRPGGMLVASGYQSKTSPPQTYRVLTDLETMILLDDSIYEECAPLLQLPPPDTALDTETASIVLRDPLPEEVIQYYRASSVALSLDGYNNTAIFSAAGTPDAPISTTAWGLMECINNTIGDAVPLVEFVDETLISGDEGTAVSGSTSAGYMSSPGTGLMLYVLVGILLFRAHLRL